MNIFVEKDFDWKPLAKRYHLKVDIMPNERVMLTASYLEAWEAKSMVEFVSACHNYDPVVAVHSIDISDINFLKSESIDVYQHKSFGIIESIH
jgi:hypothetical protein